MSKFFTSQTGKGSAIYMASVVPFSNPLVVLLLVVTTADGSRWF